MSKNKFKVILPFILSLLGAILSFAVTLVLSNGLGSQKYGQIQYWIGIIATFSSFSGFGIPNLLIRDSHLYDNKKKFFTSCLLFMLVLNVIAFPIFFLVSYFLLKELQMNVILIIALIVCSLSSTITIVLQYQYISLGQKNKSVLISSVLFKLVVLIVSTILLVTHLDSVLFDYFVLIYLACYLLVLIPPLAKNLSRTYVKMSKAQFLSALFFMIIAFCSGTTTQISKIFLGEAGEGDYLITAIYSVSVQICMVISNFTLLICSFARPKFAEYYTNNDIESTKSLYSSVLRLSCRLAIPVYLGIAIQQNSLFTLFGEGYTGYPLIFILISIAYFYSDVTGPSGTLLAMWHTEKYELIVNIVQFVIFFVLGITTVKLFYFSIPLAILVSYVLSATLRVIIIKLKFGFIAFDLKSALQILIEIAVSFAIFFGLSFISNMILKLVLDVVCGLGILAAFYLLPWFKEDTKLFFNKI